MNRLRRVIRQTERGSFVVNTPKGVSYNPKVKYYRNPAGSVVNVKYANLTTIPLKIRPKLDRKARSNAGQARGAYKPRKGGMRVTHAKRTAHLPALFGRSPSVLRYVSAGSPMGLAGMKLVGQRKTRKDKGKKRKVLYPRLRRLAA
jgi:hypothetical protein